MNTEFKKLDPLFIGLSFIGESPDLDVCLINNSDKKYKSANLLIGGFCTIDDDDWMETSKVTDHFEGLAPYSWLIIHKTNIFILDFVHWFHLDLKRQDGKIEKYIFHIGKGSGITDDTKILIPGWEREGRIIELEKRDGKAIPEEIEEMDMEAKYHEAKNKEGN
ncbi:MAG: hypothetical protein PHQ20_04220 [Candidatus Moranbacteria bacterium]|nr:hypothetical protein [Candidatus Moranbacteria bacterium]